MLDTNSIFTTVYSDGNQTASFKEEFRKNVGVYLQDDSMGGRGPVHVWSAENVIKLNPFIDELLWGDDFSGEFADFVSGKVGIINDEVKNKAVKVYEGNNSKMSFLRGSVSSENYVVQDSKKTLTIEEPLVVGVVKTSPVDLASADYSTRGNYPDAYGRVDSAKNWFKVDKKAGTAEFVHQSGSLIKLDKDGNVTIHCKGSLKQVVENDYTLEVKGSMDLIVNGDMGVNISGGESKSVGGNMDVESGGQITFKGLFINLN